MASRVADLRWIEKVEKKRCPAASQTGISIDWGFYYEALATLEIFTDGFESSDGTVTDMLTGLTWLKDASCYELAGTNTSGQAGWVTALMAPVMLVNGVCGLSDGSMTGDWRLPSINELQSIFDYEYAQPALSDTSGTAKWSNGNPFSGVVLSRYWSSTSVAAEPSLAWYAGVFDGYISGENKTNLYYVWPVRGGL